MSSGLSYAPPLYYFNNINYDPEFFVDANGGISQSYADATYLKRTGVAISTATITTFNGAVQCNAGLFISGGLTITGGLTLDTLTMSGLATFNGPSTFNVPPTMSGANITSNTIPALSIANSSLTQTQVSTGLQFVNLGVQNFSGSKTFNSPPIMSGANITSNTIPALSIVNNSLTQTQVSAGLQFIDSGVQNFSGSKTFEGSLTNQTVINISSTVPFYTGSIGFIPACTTNYLNLTTSNFDSMMYIGQPIANGVNQPYGFTMCDYNSSLTGIRISGTGAAGNCNINLNGTVVADQLMTLNNGLFVNLGDITAPNNAVLGTVFCDIFNNYDQLTGTDITLNPNNFVQCVVNAGNNSVLPTVGIGYGGLKIGWNCSNSIGETDFVNLANFANTGGFNWYTMNASTTPSLIGSLTPTALTITGSLTNKSIVNSSSTLPYFIQPNTVSLPTTTTGDPRAGFLIGWNGLSGSNGETDFTNLNQGGNQGGFLFGNIPVGGSYQKLVQISPSNATGLRVYPQCGKLQLDDVNSGAFNTILTQANNQSFYNVSGINSQLVLQCGNASAVATNAMAMTAVSVQPFVNFSPQSTTTFNSSHPTTSLGNNISTNTTQYATVGYVNSSSGTALLASNNVWTGTNEYKNTTNGIKTTAFGTLTSQYFGSGTGGSTNVVVGGNSLATVNVLNASNIAICPSPSASLGPNIGNSNIAIGTSCGITQTNANQNIFIGTTCGNAVTSGSNNICLGSNAGNGVTTGSNNTVIGNGAWPTIANFSNCTVIGASALAPTASNQIVLGRTTDTVLIPGASQINDTLMTGTTVVSNNVQVNGNIIQPILSFTTGVQNTFTSIPPYILYTPAVGQGFVLPAPSAANAGMQFVIRRVAAGSGSTIIFSCTGNPLVWVILNGTVGTASFAVASLSPSQSMWFSSGTLFYQLI